VELELGDRLVIARSGIDTDRIDPPQGGRAPGWHAGIEVARRQKHAPGAKW
jgi:hypothetical protein